MEVDIAIRMDLNRSEQIDRKPDSDQDIRDSLGGQNMADGQKNLLSDRFSEDFTVKMAGGTFVCRTAGGHELLYVNQDLIHMYECGTQEEFLEFTGGAFDGMLDEAQRQVVSKELNHQINDVRATYGYVFFNITTRQENLLRVVMHWTLVEDEAEEIVFYAVVYPHTVDNMGVDFDAVTSLSGKKRLKRHIEEKLRQDAQVQIEDYAMLYINLVNFKLLNIEKGVAEGDKCLQVMAGILSSVFGDGFVSRLSDDHFVVFCPYKGIFERTSEVERIFGETYGNLFNVIGKFGIYRFQPDAKVDVESALSLAKMACDYVKYNLNTDIAEYSASLAEKIRTSEYVVGKIDDAIKNRWIKVYYQPVIRSLTGCLCGFESLVRWIDPVVGFLPPDRFISTLEKERCIHKLDVYMVERVCESLHERMVQGLPVVPVSVNFSRLDFLLCDMLTIVEDIVTRYEIPREYIHIEITESMIASDEELMHRVVDQFREAGYQIWMDDFGSGYSSLTVLKDFQFDTLKMDMRFLSSFTEKSRNIMCSTIGMAKNIGMRTLAEGVETKEQYEFLRSIGCGMIQGYYFGRPEPLEDVFRHLEEKGIAIEQPEWRSFYEVAGFHAILTDVPLEIVEDDGTEFHTLFMNSGFRRQIFEEELELAEIDRKMYHTTSPLLKKYREFANQMEKTGRRETFYYTYNGNYMRFEGEVLAQCGDHYIIEATITNMDLDRNAGDRDRLEAKLRDLNLIYENIILGNLKENTMLPILGRFKYLSADDFTSRDLVGNIEALIMEHVLPEEREKCRRFMDAKTIRSRFEGNTNGYMEAVFRVREDDGGYAPMEFCVMMVPGSGANEYLFAMKSYPSSE